MPRARSMNALVCGIVRPTRSESTSSSLDGAPSWPAARPAASTNTRRPSQETVSCPRWKSSSNGACSGARSTSTSAAAGTETPCCWPTWPSSADRPSASAVTSAFSRPMVTSCPAEAACRKNARSPGCPTVPTTNRSGGSNTKRCMTCALSVTRSGQGQPTPSGSAPVRPPGPGVRKLLIQYPRPPDATAILRAPAATRRHRPDALGHGTSEPTPAERVLGKPGHRRPAVLGRRRAAAVERADVGRRAELAERPPGPAQVPPLRDEIDDHPNEPRVHADRPRPRRDQPEFLGACQRLAVEVLDDL